MKKLKPYTIFPNRAGTAIGKAIEKRVKRYPVFQKEPSKTAIKRKTCWIICPPFRVVFPKTVDRETMRTKYSYVIQIVSTTRREADEALEYMEYCGKEPISAGKRKEFYVSITKEEVKHSALFYAELIYGFRARNLPKEILIRRF